MRYFHWLATLAILPNAYAWEHPTTVPDTQLDAFVCSEDFQVTAWAASPLLYNPTNFDIDHRGRMWVTEGVDYRGKADRQPKGDRIVILEDTDGDGKADKSSVFWQDPELLAPLGIAVFDNVVIVSQPPNLLKLTDVNRDGKFEPDQGDTREVMLTGFNGRNHDHSLHSLTAGPDGKWYFSQGNTGGKFTDASGKTFGIGSCYIHEPYSKYVSDVTQFVGKPSDDGFVYVGGFTVRMNPDATDAEIIGHDYRNSYEQTVTSIGDVYQSDNDDPPACRVTRVIEHGSAGFFSRDGSRYWNADRRPGQDTPTAEWRQEDPGVMPAGDVYGGGSPTGVAFYENGAMGDKFIGTLLCGEPGRNTIFSYQPTRDGADAVLNRTDFLTTNPARVFDGSDFVGGVQKQQGRPVDEVKHFLFRPSDVAVGPDGAIYISDWTDPRVGGHDTQDENAFGIIYRVAPKNFKSVVPKIDPSTLAGAVQALRSPAVNTRWLGFQTLKKSGPAAFDAVVSVLNDPNPYLSARAIWLLPYLGEKGIAKLNTLLASDDENVRLTAFRAIRRTDGKVDALPFAKKLAQDPSPIVRAEAALAMRYRPFSEAKEVLVDVANRYDGKDRAYLESLGLGAGKNTADLWAALQKNASTPWSDAFARLTWRLMPEAALPALKTRATNTNLTDEQRKLAVDSIAFIKVPAAADAMMDLAKKDTPVHDQAMWWLENRNDGEWASFHLKPKMEERGLIKKQEPLVEVIVPAKPESTKFTAEEVVALKGDAAKGKIAAARCVMCHKIDGNGPDFGPDLKGFGSRQPPSVIAKAVITPSADISHGFDGTAIQLKDGRWIDGLIIAEGDPLTIRTQGGLTQKVNADQIAGRKPMDRSLMLNADQLGLSAQDLADIIEWLKGY
ncbi:HEAT repeat domain-containing protein [Luteolibacter pohnpeiensis]|uniref:HEAT repeat domain-containing protein n=1 Tax=Luteolibacter pohnpeiensis TaxID=454153 RepID=A0A934VQB5_9BACT|nr:PVC-type heme-binding CxxCH protein [Luteolibacter pohnpeiensis]MBK1881931.1 HEAT repeat domain-containing protein [Luteolibacter pohnpeiensis]